MTRARGAEEGTGGVGACRDEAARRDPVRRSSRSAPTGAKPRSGPVGFCRRGFRVGSPPAWLPAGVRPWFPIVAPPVGEGREAVSAEAEATQMRK